MVIEPLRACQYRIIVYNNGGTTVVLAEVIPVNGPNSGNHTVSGGSDLQIFIVATVALGCHCQLSILGKGIRINEIKQIFPGSTIALGMAFICRFDTHFIQRTGQSGLHSSQLWTDVIVHKMPSLLDVDLLFAVEL